MFELRATAQNLLDTSDLTEPGDLASKLAENVPSRDLRAALAEALVPYVRDLMRLQRSSNVILSPGIGRVGNRNSARSAKVAGIREAWAAALRDRVHVAAGHKMLGHCTYDDLLFAAQERRAKATANLAKAERFDWLAAQLKSHRVTTVAELPESIIGQLS